jgi:uncharacterized membrane protein YphA (DoxX/SURF4 family)
MKKFNFLDIVCVLLAILFVYAALTKLMVFDEFKAQISKSPLIMHHSWWLVWAVPTVELVVSAILFIPRLRLFALYSSFFIMFVFTIYIGFMLLFSPNLPCSCGGILSTMGWKEHFFFNVAFTTIAAVGISLSNGQNKAQLQTQM